MEVSNSFELSTLDWRSGKTEHGVLANANAASFRESVIELRRQDPGFSPRRIVFRPRPIRVGFVVEKKLSTEQTLLRILQKFSTSIMPATHFFAFQSFSTEATSALL